MGVSTGCEARRGAHPGQKRGEGVKQGGGQLRGARWRRRRAPACLPGEGKQLAGAAAGLGRQVGLPGGHQVSLCSSLIFPFLFFCKFVDFLKIPRQL